jgi:hypothetical protein
MRLKKQKKAENGKIYKLHLTANKRLAPLWVLGFFGKLIPKTKFVYICDVQL